MAVMLFHLHSFHHFFFHQVSAGQSGRKTKIQNKQEHTGVKDNESRASIPSAVVSFTVSHDQIITEK